MTDPIKPEEMYECVVRGEITSEQFVEWVYKQQSDSYTDGYHDGYDSGYDTGYDVASDPE